MADQDWLRTLLEKIDQDRREAEASVERGIRRIEHIIERIADGLESTRKEILAQNERINTRIDQVCLRFRQSAVQTGWATFGLIATVIIGFVGLIVSVVLARTWSTHSAEIAPPPTERAGVFASQLCREQAPAPGGKTAPTTHLTSRQVG